MNAKNADGVTALLMAAAHGHLPVVERLLAAGADPNTEGSIVSTIKIYTGGKTKVESRKYTPLKVAKENGYGDIVELLKKAGAKK